MTVFRSVTTQVYAATFQADNIILDNQTLVFPRHAHSQLSQNKLLLKTCLFIILKQSLKSATKCTVLGLLSITL